FDHDDVGAFLDVERDFAQGFGGVAGVHLVAAAVAELGRGFGGFAERAVKGGRKFRGVTHDGRVEVPIGIQLCANGGDAAVHHVAGGDDVGAGGGVAGGGLGEEFQCGVVEDGGGWAAFRRSAELLLGPTRFFANLPSGSSALLLLPAGRRRSQADNAAVAVFHVFAEADVGDDEQFGQFLFEQADGLLGDAVGGISAGGFGVFFVRNAEEQNGGHAGFVRGGGVAHNFVGRELEHAGHGGNGTAQFASAADEERQDELRGVQPGFTDEAAQGGGGA